MGIKTVAVWRRGEAMGPSWDFVPYDPVDLRTIMVCGVDGGQTVALNASVGSSALLSHTSKGAV